MDVAELSKLKVADLKKHLKTRGLAITGNKNELVDRLAESLQSDACLDTSGAGDDDDFDEEEILGSEDTVDIDKITQEEEAAALAGTIKLKDNSILVSNNQPEKKKISLKRSEPSLNDVTTDSIKDGATSPQKNDVGANKENNTTAAEPKHKIIKLSDEKETEVAEKPAPKPDDTDDNKKKARADRFALSLSNNSTAGAKPGKLSMETGGTDIEKLKKRAERFGEVTSKSLSKLTELEKKKERQDRFSSDSATEVKTATTDEEKTKESRAERFGVTAKDSSTKTPIVAPADVAPGKVDDAKAKRAERFAV